MPITIGRGSEPLAFDMGSAAGVPMLNFSRIGGRKDQQLTVREPGGRTLGWLVRSGSFWRRFRTGSTDLRLESEDGLHGLASLFVNPADNADKTARGVFDAEGDTIATISPVEWGIDTPARRLVYRLDCLRVTRAPMPSLLLAVLFMQYLLDRLEYRDGLLDRAARLASRPTWEQ